MAQKFGTILIAPVFKYKILLDPRSAKDNKFSVTYKDGKNWYHTRILESNFAEVYSQIQLSKQELLAMFDETDAIIGIRGDFSDEDTTKD